MQGRGVPILDDVQFGCTICRHVWHVGLYAWDLASIVSDKLLTLVMVASTFLFTRPEGVRNEKSINSDSHWG